ncbi:LPXTG cell wall anchor domain-containing protein [Carbonactinospora thermoautotrophica]|nr:LPXTG cell wall anchor domain-containing protein [Carbonactinospora thermoautotrophica]
MTGREREVALIILVGLVLLALPGLLYALGWLPR